MIVYVDTKHKCHVTNDGTMTAIEDAFFDGKCNFLIEGYCVELDENGKVLKRYPWKAYSELDSAQREYERQLIAMYEESLKTMGVVL